MFNYGGKQPVLDVFLDILGKVRWFNRLDDHIKNARGTHVFPTYTREHLLCNILYKNL